MIQNIKKWYQKFNCKMDLNIQESECLSKNRFELWFNNANRNNK